MHDRTTLFTTVLAMVHTLTRRCVPALDDPDARDRGAVSIEQVLWYAAAAISVAVVATIIWSQVKTTASTPVQSPSAP
jgi:hypothetical protein